VRAEGDLGEGAGGELEVVLGEEDAGADAVRVARIDAFAEVCSPAHSLAGDLGVAGAC